MFREIAIGVGAAAAASYAGLCTMWPTSQLYGASVVGEPRPSKRLALTYDDGPNDPYTGQLLEVLARHEVKATFFMMGKYVEMRPAIAREVAEAGHVVGNHTYSHPNLIFVSQRELRSEIERTQKAMWVEARQLVDSMATPMEKHNQRTARYKHLLDQGAISQDVHNRAVQRSKADFEQAFAKIKQLAAQLV